MSQSLFPETLFISNHSKLVTETLDGEAIIVHLETGAYFSLRGSACFIWECLQAGCSLTQLAAQIQMHFIAPPDTLEADLQTFITDLLANDLVLIVTEIPSDSHSLLAPSNTPLPFDPPVAEKFTDMADLLLIDPVHEVQEAGWPFKKEETLPS